MKQTKLMLLVGVLVILVSILLGYKEGLTAEATKYPNQDIVCIVPYVPGGTNDIIARASAPYIRKYLPRQVNVVVQNIGAAGGRIGSFQVYDAKPDGYTIGQMEPLVFIVAEAMGELGKRDITHMTWLARVATTPFIMGVSPQSSIQSLDDLKKAKRVRAAVTQAILAGNVAFLRYMGTEPQVVMYGGGADACLAAMRGDVDLVITAGYTLLRQAEASGGRLIPKVVFSERRLSVAPNLPTSRELGIDVPKEILTLMTFDAVFAAPYGMPADVHKILNEAIEKTLRDPTFIKEMENAKVPVDMLPSEEMQKRISGVSKIVPTYIEAIRQALPKLK
jgi:tripartite-type tricarboxylate transporter receptor subunit TctC